tara:strand:- start:19350 stop:19592 length:243 start_codon:yes stop_codon:yes gene_type:complete
MVNINMEYLKLLKLFKYFLIIYFLTIVKAHAYLDPGTGSIILQALLGLIAAIGATSSFYWKKIKSKIKLLLKKKNKKDFS